MPTPTPPSTRGPRYPGAVAALCLALLAGASCDGTASLRPVTAISVTNVTADTITVQLWEREDSYLVDPIPESPTTSETRDRMILPGGRRTIAASGIPGYVPGKDLRVFIYRVRGARTVFAGVQDASAASLRARRYDVLIQ